mmetsp:Transcript_8962/g.26850  ORF Transcript_8962/g.26850 Transcript_8962/m.26850 type:complete len:941 (-) Transcript_8962:2021-4843(-)
MGCAASKPSSAEGGEVHNAALKPRVQQAPAAPEINAQILVSIAENASAVEKPAGNGAYSSLATKPAAQGGPSPVAPSADKPLAAAARQAQGTPSTVDDPPPACQRTNGGVSAVTASERSAADAAAPAGGTAQGSTTSVPPAAPSEPVSAPSNDTRPDAEGAARQPSGDDLQYAEDNPHHAEFSAVKDPTIAMADVSESGHVVLHAAEGRTNFKGLADFEDVERQEANKSIMQCFGCEPGAPNNEHRFDSITTLLSSIFTMPVALVVFLDSALAYIKAETGMSQAEPTSRGLSFCTWTLVTLKPEVQVVPDTRRDGRFKTHPYVTGLPHLRFYAGAPLISSKGHRIGSLCLVDFKPRTFDAECCNILCNFAEIVVRDAERFAQEQMQSLSRWTAGPDSQWPVSSYTAHSSSGAEAVRDLAPGENTAVALVSTLEPGWPLLFVSEGFASTTGIVVDNEARTPFWDVFWQPGSQAGSSNVTPPNGAHAYNAQVAHGASFVVEVAGANIASDSVCLVRFKPAALEMLDGNQVPININIPGKLRRAVDLNPAAYYFATVQRVDRDSGSGSEMRTGGSLAAHDPQDAVPFDDVQLGGLLGKGSFGSVYIGLCDGEPVAVKVIEHKSHTDQSKASAREELEATLGLGLDHPNIVRTIKFTSVERAAARLPRRRNRLVAGATPGSDSLQTSSFGSSSGGSMFPRGRMETWIVLGLCDQGSLQAAIDEGTYRCSGNNFEGHPDMDRVLATATEIASAMEYLHEKGILHGDLTANNILLASLNGVDESSPSSSDDGSPRGPLIAKVSDFGLSRATADESAMSTNTFGTVTHMPPELLREGQLSKAVDVYAFGVLLWEMYVGERPWAGLRPVSIILKKTQGKAQLQWPNGTPQAYRALADRCMSSMPKERPPFADILNTLADLRAAAVHAELTPTDDFAVYNGWQTEHVNS